MHLNAILAAAILAVTVSGAALPQELDPAPSTVDSLPQPEMEDIEDFEEVKKRNAEAGVSYTRWRPAGTIFSKREAEADAVAEPGFRYTRWRPAGTIFSKREAEADAVAEPRFRYTRWRPAGTIFSKREAEADAVAEPGFRYTRWRPAGTVFSKREEDTDEHADVPLTLS